MLRCLPNRKQTEKGLSTDYPLFYFLLPPQGFFGQIHECSVLDFAGGMVVHMLGGLFGLVGAWVCGPRLGRFELLAEEDDDDTHSVHSGMCCDGRGPDLTDSASELAGSSTPTDASPVAAAAAACAGPDQMHGQMQQQQQLEGLCSSRSLHTLLPSVPGAAASSSRAAGMLELSQLQPPQDGLKHHPPDGPGAAGQPGPAAADTACCSRSSRPPHVDGLASDAASSGASAAVQAGSSNGQSQGGFFTRLGWKQQLQRHRRRPPRRVLDATSAGTCGRGICKFVPKAMPGHDMAFVTLGTFMLWFGWFGKLGIWEAVIWERLAVVGC